LFKVEDLEWRSADDDTYALTLEEKEDFTLVLKSAKKTINISLHAFLNLRLLTIEQPVRATFQTLKGQVFGIELDNPMSEL